jgi:integrase
LVILTQRLGVALSRTRAIYLKQLTPEKVDACLAALAEEGLSARSQNGYLQALKGMLNWAVRARKLPYNPLDCVQRRPELVKRRIRRALSEEEIGRLLAAAQEGPARRALRCYRNRPRRDGTYKPVNLPLPAQAVLAEEGRQMVLIYQIMLGTGLRRSEVRQLSWSDLDLDAGTFTTRPEWEGNKNGKRETLPLPPDLVDALRNQRQRRSAAGDAPVVKVTSRLLRCFDDDLVAAGIARRVPFDGEGRAIPLDAEGRPAHQPAAWKIDKRDAVGRVLDLHALRHTYGTRLVAAGADIKTVQTLMRHSSPELTLGIYVHADRNRLKEAVRALPPISLGTAPKESVAAEAAG